MLSKKDLDQIRNIVQEELTNYLIRTVEVEKGPRKQGDPEKSVEIQTINALDWIIHYMPLIEGALRGVQEDTNRANSKMINTSETVEALSAIMLQTEQSLKTISFISDGMKQINNIEVKQLESNT